MPEEISGKTVFSLYEVAQGIRATLAKAYPNSYWIKAELNKLNYYPHSGHCYPELVEKRDNKITAQMRSNLWREDYRRINAAFIQLINEPLKDGIKILLQAKIEFHPEYGLALHILDIDPGYTLGDLEREKQESIKRLKEEGLFTRNQELRMPLLPQRIAIISVESSNGFADFMKVMENATTTWGYSFFHLLFPSLLQGDKAVDSILQQLNQIKKVAKHFDVVAIIRGGGGDIGLSCYNNYKLAKQIALFPIPVITGIGHATNQTVSEMVAFENAITPTKLAEFIIQRFHNFSIPVQKAEEKIIDKSKRILEEERAKLKTAGKLLVSVFGRVVFNERAQIRQGIKILCLQTGFILKTNKEAIAGIPKQIGKGTEYLLGQQLQQLELTTRAMHRGGGVKLKDSSQGLIRLMNQLQQMAILGLKENRLALQAVEKNLENLRPEAVLKRGYSITRVDGKAITNSAEVNPGDLICTTLHQGEVISIVNPSS
ncbi:MAG: exodeoxyribonuclease VII large subunit [Chitinophagaceae bacterium]|nr:exodeoxyribonuclease VII large subunit [Chitinophagaceae bacterium]MCW5916379.1 exodeoxyribonuclease VII large subunit [Ferruginibacter sp.]